MSTNMEGGVRYCTTDDGVRIAYTVEGEGPPLLLVHYFHAFSLSHLVPSFDEAIREVGRGRALIRYDVRGTGLSQRDVDDMSFAACQLDIEAVVRAIEWDRVVILGATIGGARAAAFAAGHPDRVAALILYEAIASVSDLLSREILLSLAQLCRADWTMATRTMADTGIRREDEQEGLRWAEYMHNSTSGDVLARMIETHLDAHVGNELANVQCPTLVCHSRHDPIWPFASGLKLAEGIPNARFIPLEGHEFGPFTNYRTFINVLDSFMAEVSQSPPTSIHDRPAAPDKPLTPREAEVLRLVAMGLTSREISERLSLSVRTVGRHITNIYTKIGARGRADATSFALRQGLVKE